MKAYASLLLKAFLLPTSEWLHFHDLSEMIQNKPIKGEGQKRAVVGRHTVSQLKQDRTLRTAVHSRRQASPPPDDTDGPLSASLSAMSSTLSL